MPFCKQTNTSRSAGPTLAPTPEIFISEWEPVYDFELIKTIRDRQHRKFVREGI